MSTLIAIIKSLLEACVQARAALPDAWFAVNCKVPTEVIDLLNKAIAAAEKAGFAPSNQITRLITSWDYFQHGEHVHFLKEDWRSDVSNGDSLLGYQKWVEHNLESLLYDTTIDDSADVYIAGMTESGPVDEEDAAFFSVYSRTPSPNERVDDICDFNTKAQAIEFADALTARFGKTFYGNMCSVENTALSKECPMRSENAVSCQHCETCTVELPEGGPVLAIILDGGLVQAVVSDNPSAFAGVRTVIIDYDTDSLDPEDECLGIVVQEDESMTPAYIRLETIEQATIDLTQLQDFVTDKAYGSTQQRIAACGDYPCKGCPDENSDGSRCVNDENCLAWHYYKSGGA
jgi:hypothetical protein